METFMEHVALKAFCAASLIILVLSCVQYVSAMIRAILSPLSKIPGPWYSCLTTFHLNYAFASGTIWKDVEKSHKKYGSIFRLGPRQIWVADKEAMKAILMTVDLPKVAMYAEISRDRSSPGLFGEIRQDPHKHLKRFLSPAFTVSYVDGLESVFADCVKDLISKYDNALAFTKSTEQSKGPAIIDLMDDLHNVALDIMGECSFGSGFGQTNPQKSIDAGLDEKNWRKIPSAIFRGMRRRYQTVYFKRFLRRYGIHLEFDWPTEMIKAIQSVMLIRTTSSEKCRPDLLQHFIDEREKDHAKVEISPRYVVDQMAEILLAGSETTSGTIACFFLEVLRNPTVRTKLMESLPILESSDPIITGQTVRTDPKYEYLEACIKETLRLHPIASEVGRRTLNETVDLMGYVLPPSTIVSASYRDLHRNPEHWPEPLRFWPERWLQNRPPDVPPPDLDAYYPFSAGKHACIGKNFAWAEIRMVTSNILARFELSEVPGQNIDYRQYITMQFQHGSWKVFAQRRSGAQS